MTPHLEVIQINLNTTKEIVRRDANNYIADIMVDLAAKLEIEIKTLETLMTCWDNVVEMFLHIQDSFLDEYGLTPTP